MAVPQIGVQRGKKKFSMLPTRVVCKAPTADQGPLLGCALEEKSMGRGQFGQQQGLELFRGFMHPEKPFAELLGPPVAGAFPSVKWAAALRRRRSREVSFLHRREFSRWRRGKKYRLMALTENAS